MTGETIEAIVSGALLWVILNAMFSIALARGMIRWKPDNAMTRRPGWSTVVLCLAGIPLTLVARMTRRRR